MLNHKILYIIFIVISGCTRPSANYTSLSVDSKGVAYVKNIKLVKESKWYIVLSCNNESSRSEAMASTYKVQALRSIDGQVIDIQSGSPFLCNWSPSHTDNINLNLAIPLEIQTSLDCEKFYLTRIDGDLSSFSKLNLLEAAFGKHGVGNQHENTTQ